MLLTRVSVFPGPEKSIANSLNLLKFVRFVKKHVITDNKIELFT